MGCSRLGSKTHWAGVCLPSVLAFGEQISHKKMMRQRAASCLACRKLFRTFPGRLAQPSHSALNRFATRQELNLEKLRWNLHWAGQVKTRSVCWSGKTHGRDKYLNIKDLKIMPFLYRKQQQKDACEDKQSVLCRFYACLAVASAGFSATLCSTWLCCWPWSPGPRGYLENRK